MSRQRLRVVRADPAGNVTLLVLDPVPLLQRPRAAVELMERFGGEQAGFLVPPRLGGEARLEMMGGEFCGNALRCLGAYRAREAGPGRHALEISGCGRVLATETGLPGGSVRSEMPLPERTDVWHGMKTAVFPGIVHALYRGEVPARAEAARITAGLCDRFGAPAAGVMALADDLRSMVPAVYVRDTDTLTFESSCASGSAAAAALLSREAPDGDWVYPLAQPGGVILASARREAGRLTGLAIAGEVTLEPPFRVLLSEDDLP